MPSRLKVEIEDIQDAEAFVRSLLPRVLLTPDKREDLIQTGLTILQEMVNKYEPGRGGQDPATSRFSGFAAKYLPSKLRDAWHRSEGHSLSTDADGRRAWTYPPPVASLDQLRERDGGLDSVRALQGHDVHESELALTLRRALEDQDREDRDVVVSVGVLLGEGLSPAAVAERLHLRDKQVSVAAKRIERVIPRMTTMEAA